jgi:hypothetical protein
MNMANQQSGKSAGGSQGKPGMGTIQPLDANTGMRPNTERPTESDPSAQVLHPSTNSVMKPLSSPKGEKRS